MHSRKQKGGISTNNRSDLPAIVIAIAVLAIVVIGEVVVYTSDYTDYSAEASLDDGKLSFSVSADGSKEYATIVMDDGGFEPISRLYLYYDHSYPSDYEAVDADVGAPVFNQEYYLEQLKELLGFRSTIDIRFVDATELGEILDREIQNDTCHGSGLVVVSGALPETVYTGKSTDAIFGWMDAGGSLYWAGNALGMNYATPNGLVPVDDYQELFFGGECLYTGDDNKAYNEVSSNGFRGALSLMNNDIRYGVNPELVGQDRRSLCIGYESNGYCSIGMVQHGEGMICVFGGQLSNFQRYDIAQVIAAGLSPWSELLDVRTGEVTRGSVSDTIEGLPDENVSVYIYLGGYYPVYGKLFGF